MEDKVYLIVDGVVYDAGTDTDLVNQAASMGLEPDSYEISEIADFDNGVWLQGQILSLSREDIERLTRLFG